MDRYKSMKLLQIQTTGDEFFLLDNEVNSFLARSLCDQCFFRILSGKICKESRVERIYGMTDKFLSFTLNNCSFYYSRRIPNAEHQCIGHLISILFTIRSFYLSVYEVGAVILR